MLQFVLRWEKDSVAAAKREISVVFWGGGWEVVVRVFGDDDGFEVEDIPLGFKVDVIGPCP